MRRFCAARVLAAAAATVWATELTVAVAAVQTPLPGGVPDFCANPTMTSARSGSSSDPLTWSPARVPSAGDLVRIDAGDTVTYTSVSDAALNGISISGQLAFGTGALTRLIVGTLTVMEGGVLTVGTMSAPVPAGITAELVIANQPLNTSLDPDRFGTALLGLGTVTMHGAEKTPTLQFNHFGARDGVTGNGTLRLLPHVGNLTRNVVVRSQSPIGSGGTQGHTFFIGRANVDIRYVAFRDLGGTVTVNVDANIGLCAHRDVDDRGADCDGDAARPPPVMAAP